MVVRWLNLSTRLLALTVILAAICGDRALSQERAATPGQITSSAPGRRLSADAFYIIPPSAETGDTYEGPIDLPFVTPPSDLSWEPNFAGRSETLLAMSKSVTLRREVWSLEFAFKPVRMIAVDLPNADGQTETKIVWYLLYSVRYKGNDLVPNLSKDQFGTEVYTQPSVDAGKSARRFLPGFVLNAAALGKRYQSRFVPEAVSLIAEKERVGKPVYDSVAIQKVPIPLSTSRESHEVWGVATWTDIDPRTDFFSVEVRGLTNAQRSEMVNGEIVSTQKTLVLNFSRPGDTVNELADRIRYGIPATVDPVQQKAILAKYGLRERLDHYWIFR